MSLSDADAEQEAAVVGLVRSVLGEDVLGVQRYGSAVHGGLQRFSDLDLLGVTQRTITPERPQELVEGLLTVSESEPGVRARSVELTIVVAARYDPGTIRPAWICSTASGCAPSWPPASALVTREGISRVAVTVAAASPTSAGYTALPEVCRKCGDKHDNHR